MSIGRFTCPLSRMKEACKQHHNKKIIHPIYFHFFLWNWIVHTSSYTQLLDTVRSYENHKNEGNKRNRPLKQADTYSSVTESDITSWHYHTSPKRHYIMTRSPHLQNFFQTNYDFRNYKKAVPVMTMFVRCISPGSMSSQLVSTKERQVNVSIYHQLYHVCLTIYMSCHIQEYIIPTPQ